MISFKDHTVVGRRIFMLAVAYAEGRRDGGFHEYQEDFAALFPGEANPETASVVCFANWAACRADDHELGIGKAIPSMKLLYEAYHRGVQIEMVRAAMRRHPSNYDPEAG